MSRRVLATLAGVMFLRIMGVSLVLPGFARHGESLGGTIAASGLAFAAYPLALALFLFPLAKLSDRIGRRAVLAGGLALSALGGLVAAAAPSVLLLGVGRFVQGAGAVNAVALTAAGEAGPEDGRTQRMAVLGAGAGAGFGAGLIVGAALDPWLGVPGLLVLHSAALLAIALPVARLMPRGKPATRAAPLSAAAPRASRGPIARLGLGGFATNASMTALLFLAPLLITAAAPDAPMRLILVAMVLPGGLGIFIAARLSDRGRARAVAGASAVLLGVAPLAFLAGSAALALVAAGVAYFIGHSSLMALLPARVAAVAPEDGRGAAQGVQSAMQALGSSAGAALAGALWPNPFSLAALFLLAGLIVAMVLVPRARPVDAIAAPA